MPLTKSGEVPALRPMIPREHGAWGELVLPLLAGLLIGSPSLGAVLLAMAVVFAFSLHEPLLVLLGQRGRRRQEDEGVRALRWTVGLAALALLAGSAGVAFTSSATHVSLLFPVAFAAVVSVLVFFGLEKTFAGEILVAAALASAGGSVALAAGATALKAASASVAWTLSFAATTLGVRAVLARSRSRGSEDEGRRNALLAFAIGAFAFFLSFAGMPYAVAWATLPGAAVGVATSLAPLKGRQLRPVGFTILGVSVLTFAILVLGLRG